MIFFLWWNLVLNPARACAWETHDAVGVGVERLFNDLAASAENKVGEKLANPPVLDGAASRLIVASPHSHELDTRVQNLLTSKEKQEVLVGRQDARQLNETKPSDSSGPFNQTTL